MSAFDLENRFIRITFGYAGDEDGALAEREKGNCSILLRSDPELLFAVFTDTRYHQL